MAFEKSMWFVYRLNFSLYYFKTFDPVLKKKLSMDTNANESLCQRAEETQMVVSPVILELPQAQTKESLGLTDPSV